MPAPTKKKVEEKKVEGPVLLRHKETGVLVWANPTLLKNPNMERVDPDKVLKKK